MANFPAGHIDWVDEDTVVYVLAADPHDLAGTKVAVAHQLLTSAAITYSLNKVENRWSLLGTRCPSIPTPAVWSTGSVEAPSGPLGTTRSPAPPIPWDKLECNTPTARPSIVIATGYQILRMLEGEREVLIADVGAEDKICIDSYSIQPNTTYEHFVVAGTPSAMERHTGWIRVRTLPFP